MMCSVQLEQGKLILRGTGSVGKLADYVKEVLESRGINPREHQALWRAMVNRVIVNYTYDLKEQEELGYR